MSYVLNVNDVKFLFRVSLDERLTSIQLVSAEPMVSDNQKSRYILYMEPRLYYRFDGCLFEPGEARIVDYILNIVRNKKLYKEYNDENLLDLLEQIDKSFHGVVDGIRSEITRLCVQTLIVKPLRYEHCDPQVAWKGEVNKADFLAKYLNIPMEKDKPKAVAVDCCGTNSFPIPNNLMDQLRDAIKEDMQKETEKSLYLSFPRKNGKSLYLDAMLDAMRKPQNTWGYTTTKYSTKYSSYSSIFANAFSKETKNMKREFIREEKPQTFENIVREAYYYPSFFDLSALEATDVFIKVDDELRTIYMVVEGENELKSKKTVLNIFTGKLEKMDNETKVHLFDIDEVKFVTGRFVTDTKKAEGVEV